MRSIAIIPARSGSKGVKDKNINMLIDKPLMAYSINAAIQSQKFDEVFVSTDSDRYAQIAKNFGADASFLRTPANATDSSSTWDMVKEVISKFKEKGKQFDTVMLLQPTSPLRNELDIRAAFELFSYKRANSVLSVTETEHSPIWCNTISDDLVMDDFIEEKYFGISRQELPKYYRLNGAIYLFKVSEMDMKVMFKKKCYAYIMPNERSIDIDSEIDLAIAEILLKKMNATNLS